MSWLKGGPLSSCDQSVPNKTHPIEGDFCGVHVLLKCAFILIYWTRSRTSSGITHIQTTNATMIPSARAKCHQICSWPCFLRKDRNVTTKSIYLGIFNLRLNVFYPDARLSIAFVKNAKLNQTSSGATRSSCSTTLELWNFKNRVQQALNYLAFNFKVW